MHPKIFILLVLTAITGTIKSQNALDFDGTDDKIDCGNDTSVQISGKAITLEAWIYPTVWKTNVYDGNIINKEYNTSNYGYMLRTGAGGKLNFGMGNGSWTELTSATTMLSLNKWQHVAATYDGSKIRLYLNGVLTDSMAATIAITNASVTNLVLGYNVTYGRYYQGMIDEVRIWNVCRTQAQLYNNMSSEFCSVQKGLRAYYKFNQGKAGGSNGTVKTLTDYSGYGNTGTLSGFTLNGSSSNWLSSQYLSRTVALTKDSVVRCDFFNSPSGKYKWTKTGIYYDTLPVVFGCDSVIKYNVTIKKSSTKLINVFACQSYKSPSGLYTWTKSGTYKDNLKNYLQCDSILTIVLKIGGSRDSVTAVACDRYKSPKGKTYTTSGFYSDTLKDYRNCDSVIITKLTIKKSSTFTLNEKACRSYISPSGKYTFKKSGIYKDTIKNYLNCDSIMIINLTILTSSGTLTGKACKQFKSPSGKYTWTTSGTYKDTIANIAGCDSFITINLTINKTSTASTNVSTCRSYTSKGKKRTWKISGIYKDTLVNYSGCDSILTINLKIKNVDKSVTQSVNTLSAVSPTGTFQWLNCPQMGKISGETNRSYKVSAKGDYAVEVTDSGCVDTSSCISVTPVGIMHLNSANISFGINPNPNKGLFDIILPFESINTLVRIRDISGKLLFEQSFENTSKCRIATDNLRTSGIYLIEVNTGECRIVQSMVVE